MQEFSRYPTNPSTPPVNEMHLNGSSLPAEWIGEATERALLPLKQGMDKMYKKLYNGIASTIVDSHAHPQSSSTLPQHLVETVRLHQEDNKRLRQENRELLHRDERREREMLGLRSEIHALNAETRQLRTALHMAENRALEVCTKYQAALEQGSRLMNEARMVRASTANASSGVRDAPEVSVSCCKIILGLHTGCSPNQCGLEYLKQPGSPSIGRLPALTNSNVPEATESHSNFLVQLSLPASREMLPGRRQDFVWRVPQTIENPH